MSRPNTTTAASWPSKKTCRCSRSLTKRCGATNRPPINTEFDKHRKGPMAQGKPKFYLTTPIYYTNGLPHIGHTYSTTVCDAIRRYKRMLGFEVILTTGTDEHGVNVERSAKKAGIP